MIWVLLFEGEGCPSRVHLFRENNPPSIQRIEEILIEWGEVYKLDKKLDAIRSGRDFCESYEKLSLSMMDVE